MSGNRLNQINDENFILLLHCGETNDVGGLGGNLPQVESILSFPFLFPRSFPPSPKIRHFHANAAPFIPGIALFSPSSLPCCRIVTSLRRHIADWCNHASLNRESGAQAEVSSWCFYRFKVSIDPYRWYFPCVGVVLISDFAVLHTPN